MKNIVRIITESISARTAKVHAGCPADADIFKSKIRSSWRYEQNKASDHLCCLNQYSLYKDTPCSMYHIRLWNTSSLRSQYELTVKTAKVK